MSNPSRIKALVAEPLLAIYRLLFARPMFYGMNKLLHGCALRGIGILNCKNDRVSGESHFLRSFLSKRPHAVVFDVGANVGDYSRRIMEITPGATVYAFEPHPATFRKLLKTSATCGFQAFPFGCGSENSRTRLYDYVDRNGSSHASLYPEVFREIHGSDVAEQLVDIVKLDDFVLQNDITAIDLLKIDTEGHELNVLLGLENFISLGKVRNIHFEFNEMNIVSRVFFRDIHRLLNNRYDFFRMLPGGLVPLDGYNTVLWEIFAYQNVVATLRAG